MKDVPVGDLPEGVPVQLTMVTGKKNSLGDPTCIVMRDNGTVEVGRWSVKSSTLVRPIGNFERLLGE